MVSRTARKLRSSAWVEDHITAGGTSFFRTALFESCVASLEGLADALKPHDFNDLISNLERGVGELHAKLMGGTSVSA